MGTSSLDREITAYRSLLPEIKRKYGSAWALVANSELVSTFANFSAAAKYARENYGAQAVLIRHTDEKELETAPFAHVRTEG